MDCTPIVRLRPWGAAVYTSYTILFEPHVTSRLQHCTIADALRTLPGPASDGVVPARSGVPSRNCRKVREMSKDKASANVSWRIWVIIATFLQPWHGCTGGPIQIGTAVAGRGGRLGFEKSTDAQRLL